MQERKSSKRVKINTYVKAPTNLLQWGHILPPGRGACVVVTRPPRSLTSEMTERKLTSISLQKFTELEELAEEIMGDKHQVKDSKS